MKNRITFYNLNYKVDWGDGFKSFRQTEFHFLPMLRYLNHGVNDKMIQFRWFIWGINIRIK